MIVYHGSLDIVERPDVLHSYRPLDFGKGFYVTTNLKQAEQWAVRKTLIVGKGKPIINTYQMSDHWGDLRVKTFDEDLMEWIDFVCACRDGADIYQAYDLICGKVANDKVFRVVEKYHSGDWERERALKEIRAYPRYDQTAFITQKAIDQLLSFSGYKEV